MVTASWLTSNNESDRRTKRHLRCRPPHSSCRRSKDINYLVDRHNAQRSTIYTLAGAFTLHMFQWRQRLYSCSGEWMVFRNGIEYILNSFSSHMRKGVVCLVTIVATWTVWPPFDCCTSMDTPIQSFWVDFTGCNARD